MNTPWVGGRDATGRVACQRNIDTGSPDEVQSTTNVWTRDCVETLGGCISDSREMRDLRNNDGWAEVGHCRHSQESASNFSLSAFGKNFNATSATGSYASIQKAERSCGILLYMANNQPNLLRHIAVRRATIDQMLKTMRDFGSNGWEALVLWLGEIEPNTGSAHVTQAFVPKQKSISNENGVGYFVNGETLFQLNRDLSETGLRLIAQVHSHPQEAYHSKADDRYAIVTAEGGLSLVVPNFGRAPAQPTAWAVYRLHGSAWRALSATDVGTLFEVIDDQ